MAIIFPLAFRLELPENVQDVALHPTLRVLASALDDGRLLLHVYDPSEAAAGSLQLWAGHSLRPFASAVQPDCTAVCFVAGEGCQAGGLVVSGSPSGSIFAADVETGREVCAPRAGAHTSRIKAAAGLGPPNLLASGDSRGMVQLWDLRTGGAIASMQLQTGGVTDLCVVAGKDALLAAGSNGLEGGLSTISLRHPKVMSAWQHPAGVHAVATLHGGRTVVCGDEQGRWGFGRWGQLRGREVAFRAGHSGAAVSALVACDDTGIVSASSDGSIKASRVEGPPVEVISRASVQAHAGGSRVRLALSGSGSFLASAAVGERTVQLWHTSLLFSQQPGTAGSPLPKLSLRRDAAASAAAAAAAAAASPGRSQGQGRDSSASEEEHSLCTICLEREATGGFAHGGTMHSGFCATCIRAEKQLRPGKCPACRGRVDAYVERMFC